METGKQQPGDGLSVRAAFFVAFIILVLQAWLKLRLAASLPFGGEQFRDWLAALHFMREGAVPAYGPPMATGPAIPGAWYYFLLSQGLRLGETPLVLSWELTGLYTLAAAFLTWRMARVFGRLAALTILALLSFHPVVITMSALYHNPNVAFPFLMVVLGALLGQKIRFAGAALAAFCSVVAMQCNLPAVIALGAPLVWIIAKLGRQQEWGFSWTGYVFGLAVGCIGYAPYLQDQAAQGFTHVSQGAEYRHLLRFNLENQVLKPVFFFVTQPGFEVSSYFGSRFHGFIEYFRHFQSPEDLLAVLITYASFTGAVALGVMTWKGAFRGSGSWAHRLLDPWQLGLYRVVTLTLPFWFILAGRFDVKYVGLFFAWSYLPLAWWLSQSQLGSSRERRWLLALAVALICLGGVSLNRRIYAQRGIDLEFPRYSYRTADALALHLALRQPETAGIHFVSGGEPGFINAVFGLATERYHWYGTYADLSPQQLLICPSGQAPASDLVRWHFLQNIEGMDLYANF